MDIIMDEKKEAEIVIKNNEINMNKPSQTIQLLIKYYYNVKHMNKEDIRKEIEKYMQNNYKGFNSTRWQKSLDDMVQRWAKDKYKLINIHRIIITEKEFNIIQKLNDIDLEKLAFTLLVYVKTYNQINEYNNNWIRFKRNEILKDAKISIKNKDIKKKTKLFNQLYEKKYIIFAKKIDNTSIQVQYINNISSVKIEINKLENFIGEYLKYKKGYCQICGKKIRSKSPKTKYCTRCAKKIAQEQKNKWKRENWNRKEEK